MNTKSIFDGLDAIAKHYDIKNTWAVGPYVFYHAAAKRNAAIKVWWVAVSTPQSDGKWLRGEPYTCLEDALRAAAEAERDERIRKAQKSVRAPCVPYPLEDEGGPD